MRLYSATVILEFVLRNSGDARYLSNSRDQSPSVSGGDSHSNRQSVMLRPLRVSRVTPPRTTMLKTQATPPPSQTPTRHRATSGPATKG